MLAIVREAGARTSPAGNPTWSPAAVVTQSASSSVHAPAGRGCQAGPPPAGGRSAACRSRRTPQDRGCRPRAELPAQRNKVVLVAAGADTQQKQRCGPGHLCSNTWKAEALGHVPTEKNRSETRVNSVSSEVKERQSGPRFPASEGGS